MLGAAFLWISLICAGVICSIKLKKRVTLLEKTIVMLEELKIQIQFLNMPVYEMLETTGKKEYLSNLDYLSVCCEEMKKGKDFPEAWKLSIVNTLQLYKREEKERLLQLGTNLGTSNTESQINIIDSQMVSFDEFLTKAKNSSMKYSNMATLLGVLSGCMIFIVLI